MKKEKIKLYDSNLKNDHNKFERKKYATFLKRKRLEKNMTLEEVASGVCAVSYLSRIENNLVDVGEEYFVQLFQKLDINFYQLKEEKEHEIFIIILKNYLLKEDELIKNIISEALKTNFYNEIEYELMMLYDNICRKLYAEARKQIIEINNKIDILLDNELLFYLFLSSLYAYRTNQSLFAYRQIIVLCEMKTVDEIYKYAIYDLALDIFELVGAKESFFKYYQEINNNNFTSYYSNAALKHKAQMLYLAYSFKTDETYNELLEIKYNIDPKYWEEIDWLILKNEYRFSNYRRCFDFLKEITLSPKLLAFESILVLMNEKTLQLSILKEHKENIAFDKYDRIYELVYDLCTIVKTKNFEFDSFGMMKEILTMQIEEVGEEFFMSIEKIMFMELGMKFGKYKDCLKFILNYERLKNKVANFF